MNQAPPPKAVLFLGLALLLAGGFPWIYTPLLTGGTSGTPGGGDEASGMLGTLLFLVLGLPGLMRTLCALRALRQRR